METEFNDVAQFSAEASGAFLNKIIVHKVNGDKTHLRLEIVLNIGKNYVAEMKKNYFISLQEIGITYNEMQYVFTRCKDAYKGNYNAVFDVEIKVTV